MSWFWAAQRLLAADRAAITLDADRCLRARDRFSTCEMCVQACPVQALHRDHPIALESEACVRCGLCLPLCPVGAFRGDDHLGDLLSRAASSRAETLEVACPRHPALERGPAEADATVQTPGCLAALGPSAYLGLLAQGSRQVMVRLDACAECSLGQAQPVISQLIAVARELLAARGEPDRLVEVRTDPGPGWVVRPRVRAGPAISRRDLFQTLLQEGKRVASSVIALDEAPNPKTKSAPRERKRLLKALSLLPAVQTGTLVLTPALPFARFSVDEKCSACGSCARVCPTGALQFATEGNYYRLAFTTGDCTNCGICLDLCEPQALSRDAELPLGELLEQPRTLQAGTLLTCARCGAKFAGGAQSTLCPVCDFREQHPFGTRTPPGLRRPGAG